MAFVSLILVSYFYHVLNRMKMFLNSAHGFCSEGDAGDARLVLIIALICGKKPRPEGPSEFSKS